MTSLINSHPDFGHLEVIGGHHSTHLLTHFQAMNRSISLLSAITLSSAALLSVQPQEASAMAIAFDCFERSTEKLVARSAVDMTSTAISCLPVPGGPTNIADNSDGLDEDTLDLGDEEPLFPGDGDNLIPDEGDIGAVDDEDDDTTGGETTSEKIADLLGHLIGQGINDLLR